MADFWVIDFETISNCTILCAENYKSNDKRTFIIHELENNFDVMVNFLEYNAQMGNRHISFNGLGFDAQIETWILHHKLELKGMSGEDIARNIYRKAQDIIDRSSRREWQEYPEWKLLIKQVDVFAVNNWLNPGKTCSLKWAQCSMDWHNVQDMPIQHTATITTRAEIDMIVSYCHNDVAATKKIAILCKDQLNLRAQLTKEYGIDLYCASEPKMAKELFLHFLSQTTGQDKYEMKKINTQRDRIDVDKIILPYIKFERQEFQMLLNNFKTLVINGNNLRGAFKYSVSYRGIKLSYGIGGLHSEAKPGVFEAGNGKIIMDSDVSSYYPNLAIKNKWSPAHIPKKAFCDQYEWFYEERKKYPKKDPKNHAFKITLNSVFGLSIEPNSFLADASLGVQITVNGQLQLSMLIEMICEGIPDAVPLVANTDGVSFMIKEEDKPTYLTICAEWEKLTMLTLEHEQFSKLCSFDCNNFIGKYVNGKTKCKGRFEFEPHDNYEAGVLHKNKSFLIVPKAVYHFLINGTPPEQYLQENRNIFDYCGFVRAKGAWQLTKFITGKDGVIKEVLQKTLRYYVSKKGHKIIKVNKNDKREISIEAGQPMCTVFNLYEKKEWADYDVDDKYYLKQIYKELETVQPKPKKQMKLSL